MIHPINKKVKILRKSFIIPIADFRPYSFYDFLKILLNSIYYNYESFKRILKFKLNLNISFTGNPIVPFGCRVKTTYKGVMLVFEIRSNSDDFYILRPKYEEDYLEFFKPKKGDLVLDVGAHVGKYTCYAGKLVGEEGKVVSIEANPHNYKYLIKNIKLNNLEDVVIAYNLAASDKNGTTELFVPKDYGRSTIISDRVSGEKVKVRCIRLENLLNELGINKIDWMKMDIEGAEIKALKGLSNYLNKIENILIEVSNKNESKFLKIMNRYNFQVKVLSRYSGQVYYFASKDL